MIAVTVIFTLPPSTPVQRPFCEIQTANCRGLKGRFLISQKLTCYMNTDTDWRRDVWWGEMGHWKQLGRSVWGLSGVCVHVQVRRSIHVCEWVGVCVTIPSHPIPSPVNPKLTFTFTFTFKSFSRRSYPERLTNWCIHLMTSSGTVTLQ
jgi:hypothetical protein